MKNLKSFLSSKGFEDGAEGYASFRKGKSKKQKNQKKKKKEKQKKQKPVLVTMTDGDVQEKEFAVLVEEAIQHWVEGEDPKTGKLNFRKPRNWASVLKLFQLQKKALAIKERLLKCNTYYANLFLLNHKIETKRCRGGATVAYLVKPNGKPDFRLFDLKGGVTDRLLHKYVTNGEEKMLEWYFIKTEETKFSVCCSLNAVNNLKNIKKKSF